MTTDAVDLVDVRILQLPLAAYKAALEHSDDLKRELALLKAADPDELGVPSRLLRVVEELDATYGAFTAEPRAELAAALARGDQRIDLTYRVPRSAREAAQRLWVTYDEADAFCRAGEHLLTLATPPVALAFRRWFLGEFANQIGGLPPVPWEESPFAKSLAAEGHSADAPVDDLARTFASIARELGAQDSVEATLERIVELAVATIDGCDHAGVTMVEKGQFRTPVASDDVPCRVDAIQYETNEGPCIDAIREHEVFRTDDVSSETRWPEFSRRAAEETGVASMLAFRLFMEEHTMGALNLYSRDEAAFGEHEEAVGSIFAAHASVALDAAKEQSYLRQALDNRDVIGQAKGLLMAHRQIGAGEAFEILRAASQNLNIKLRDLARQVAEGSLPLPDVYEGAAQDTDASEPASEDAPASD